MGPRLITLLLKDSMTWERPVFLMRNLRRAQPKAIELGRHIDKAIGRQRSQSKASWVPLVPVKGTLPW